MRNSVIAMVALMLVLTAVPGIRTATADEATVNKKKLQRIQREMRDKQNKIKRADKKERSILADLNRIDRDTQAEKAELAAQQQRLLEAEISLHDAEKDSARIGADLGGLKRSYAERLKALYKMSRSGGSAVAVLASDGLAGSLKRIKYLSIITERDHELMRSYGDALNALAVRQAEMSEKREAILERKRTIETKKTEYQSLKQKKAALLAEVRGQKGLYEQTLHELEESSVSLWAMIKRTEQERKTEANAVRSARTTPAREPSTGKSRLPWPAEGPVLTRFGMQRHPQFGTPVFRRGIEIAVREGTPVRAVSDGLVAYADWYKGYGKLVIIEHSPGFYTLYGNLSQLDLSAGGRVVKGQVIGLAGDTGSLKGSKLYFEVRWNGAAQDPLAWLAKR